MPKYNSTEKTFTQFYLASRVKEVVAEAFEKFSRYGDLNNSGKSEILLESLVSEIDDKFIVTCRSKSRKEAMLFYQNNTK